MANKRDPHTPPWAPFPPVPRSAGRRTDGSIELAPSPQVRPRTDAQVPPGRGNGSSVPRWPMRAVPLRGRSRWSWFLNLFRRVSGSLGSSGLLARRPGTWPQCPGCWPALWASEQTAQESEHLFSQPTPPQLVPTHLSWRGLNSLFPELSWASSSGLGPPPSHLLPRAASRFHGPAL